MSKNYVNFSILQTRLQIEGLLADVNRTMLERYQRGGGLRPRLTDQPPLTDLLHNLMSATAQQQEDEALRGFFSTKDGKVTTNDEQLIMEMMDYITAKKFVEDYLIKKRMTTGDVWAKEFDTMHTTMETLEMEYVFMQAETTAKMEAETMHGTSSGASSSGTTTTTVPLLQLGCHPAHHLH